MVDTTVQPGDAQRVAVAVEHWPSSGCLCLLPASPASDLHVPGGFGLLGDEECSVPSSRRQRARDAASILAKGGVGALLGVRVGFQFGAAPFAQPLLCCKEKHLGPVPLAPA